jgi:chaperone protein PapD
MKMQKLLVGNALVLILMVATAPSKAAVALDRTRAIFDGGNKSMSLNISNDSKQLPYLAQAWLEDAQHQKITQGPVVVTPPVQRLEPGAKSMLRVSATPGVSQLPQDRESLFYFNLREIPPRSDKPNVLQIALQTKIKLFYRPKAILPAPGAVWQDQLVLEQEPQGYRIQNPTPYYVTVIGLGGDKGQAETGKFDGVMVPPKDSVQVKSAHYGSPYLVYINDYGGRPVLKFTCSGPRCVAQKS